MWFDFEYDTMGTVPETPVGIPIMPFEVTTNETGS